MLIAAGSVNEEEQLNQPSSKDIDDTIMHTGLLQGENTTSILPMTEMEEKTAGKMRM